MTEGIALEVRDASVRFGAVRALQRVSLSVRRGGITAVVGTNGAGKSTLLRAIGGLVRLSSGTIEFPPGHSLEKTPAYRRVRQHGITLVPEGRGVFQRMTVYENLALGARIGSLRTSGVPAAMIDEVMELFPILRERRRQAADSLSGGEQQMLSIARGLLTEPELLLLDEPSSGLAPVIVDAIFERLEAYLQGKGFSVLLVEQNTELALELADYAYVMEHGAVQFAGRAAELLIDPRLQASYLGI